MQKDVEAARSTLKDIFKNVKPEFQVPDDLYSIIIDIYKQYDTPTSSFPFTFDLLDLTDFITFFVKVEAVVDHNLVETYMQEGEVKVVVIRNTKFQNLKE